MRYNPVLHRKNRTSRRGIAVMFALGILSLVIVAVLIFSQRAVTDRKVASAYAHYSGAKDLAQSAFGRALLQLKKNAAAGAAFYSGGAGDNDFDWLWKLDPGRRILPQDGSCPVRWQYVRDSNGHIIGRYAYVIIGEKRLNLDAILDHSFCLAGVQCDGGAGCVRAERHGNTATELQFDPSKFSGYFTIDGAPFANGAASATPAENKAKLQSLKIQFEGPEDLLRDAGLSLVGSKTWTDALNRVNSYFNVSLSSALNEPDAWFGGDTNGNGVKDKSEYYQRFLLNKTAAEWDALANSPTSAVNTLIADVVSFYDASGNPRTENTTGIPWLRRWSDTTGNWSSGASKGKQIAANIVNYCSKEETPVVSNISPENWYSGSGYTAPEYTGNKRTWYLNECGVTLEIEVDLGTAKPHPYKVSGVDHYWYSFGDNGSKITLTSRLYIEPEIINMYGATLSGCKLPGAANKHRIVGFANLTFDYTQNMSYTPSADGTSFTNKAGTYLTFTKDYKCLGSGLGDSTIKCHSTGITKNPSGTVELYEKFAFGKKIGSTSTYYDYLEETIEISGTFASESSTPPDSEIGALLKVKGISVSNLAMFLKTEVFTDDKYRYVDCAILPTVQASAEQNLPAKAPAPALKKYLWVDDPRNNLHAADWTQSDTGTLGSANTGVTCKNVKASDAAYTGVIWEQDPETAEEPAGGTISTAYIRHAPIQSLWELGAIHRAAPWQTLNLKRPTSCSDTLTTNLTTKGGGAYKDGDFRILDQVTMQGWYDPTPAKNHIYTPMAQFGKVNLYAPNTGVRHFVFDSLFRGMPWSTDGKYSDLSSTTGTITDSDALADKLGTAVNNKLYRRSDIYQTSSGSFWELLEKSPVNGSVLKTDALQEQLIGRFIGLTTANAVPDSATVIVLAQSIKDLGGGGTVYCDWEGNGTLTGTASSDSAKLKAGYYFYPGNSDTITNPGFFSVPANLNREITVKFGRYDVGADRITGETRLVGRLLYDQGSGKWKIIQVKYDED